MLGDGEATGMDGHTLVVLRHAKAAGEPGVNDVQRPLTGGGCRDAAAAGRWLLAQGIRPDLVLCSSARRTRETWEQVSVAMGAAAPDAAAVSFESRVYDAGAQDLLDLVTWLTGRSDIAFPACALAVVRLGESWAAVVPGGGELAALWAPGPAA